VRAVSEAYIRTASRLGWLLQAAEAALADQGDGAKIDLTFFTRLGTKKLPSEDEGLAVAEALVSLGVLRRVRGGFSLDRRKLLEKLEYGRGVREALGAKDLNSQSTVKLCAALPVGLDGEVEKALRRNTVDIRANLLEIIASAQRWVALASPFWDAETASEIAEVLSRRLEAGTRVDILGRFEGNDEGMRQLQARLGGYEHCQLFSWIEKSAADRFRKQTFHFKAAVADDGHKAYLGTANLNVAGLRSRMELGVILEGEVARRLADIIKVTLSIARPLPRPGPSGQRRTP
jgi:phosphatidylserine/phosphatidylglycerophosphate/cardiolipin synthase-like enzyme